MRLYAPLIVNDHLHRLAYVARWSFPDHRLPSTLVAAWAQLQAISPSTVHAYDDAVQDRDLWLIATAAEVLGADHRDHSLMKLDPARRLELERLVQTGASLVASRRHSHEILDTRGRKIVADSYFDGDYDDHPDMRFAGDHDERLPTGLPEPAHGLSWDISHIYRLPVLFRSLVQNRSALSGTFPTDAEVTQLANQYVYVVFGGRMGQPLPTNFFDGSDGWYRVSTMGGYSPSVFCNVKNPTRSCLSAEAALYGWELLAFRSKPLRDLQSALLGLAMRTDSVAVAFRDRHYMQGGRPFALPRLSKGAVYSIPIYSLLSARVDTLR